MDVEQELRVWCEETQVSSVVPPLSEHKAMLLRAADAIADLKAALAQAQNP